MRAEIALIVLAFIASAAHFSGAARSASAADHHIWSKQPREITSNSLLDLEYESTVVGGNKEKPSDFTTRLLRQRVAEMPDLRNIRRQYVDQDICPLGKFFYDRPLKGLRKIFTCKIQGIGNVASRARF